MAVPKGVEEGTPVVIRRALPEGVGGGVGMWFPMDSRHAERAYRAAWFADFRARWQRALRAKRHEFYGRMAAFTEETNG